jgi:hypothetical protein
MRGGEPSRATSRANGKLGDYVEKGIAKEMRSFDVNAHTNVKCLNEEA